MLDVHGSDLYSLMYGRISGGSAYIVLNVSASYSFSQLIAVRRVNANNLVCSDWRRASVMSDIT